MLVATRSLLFHRLGYDALKRLAIARVTREIKVGQPSSCAQREATCSPEQPAALTYESADTVFNVSSVLAVLCYYMQELVKQAKRGAARGRGCIMHRGPT
jgi:hypothetical protein